MSGAVAVKSQFKAKVFLWAMICVGMATVLIANAHLVYMAVVSQPDCVAHMRRGEVALDRGKFSAAKSSCTPR